MSGFHYGLALVAAATVVTLFVLALAAALGWAGARRWLDRAVLSQAALALVTGLSGLALIVAGSRPSDPLHVLYAAVLVVFPLGLRLAAGRRPTRRVGTWLVLASLVLAGVLVRAFMTGA